MAKPDKDGLFGDWDLWLSITDPARAKRLIDTNLSTAGERIGLTGVQMVTDLLSERPADPIVPNSAVSVAMKGKDAALVGKQNTIATGTKFVQPEPGLIIIGTRKTAPNGQDITRALHYGFTFTKAKYPRNWRWLMAKIHELVKAGKLPERPAADARSVDRPGEPAIVIPPRPWYQWLFESDEFRDCVPKHARAAMQASMQGRDLKTGLRRGAGGRFRRG